MIPTMMPIAPEDIAFAGSLVALTTVEEAQEIVEDDALKLIARRVARERRGGPRVQPRCCHCKRFVASMGRECGSCGRYPDNGALPGWAA